MKKVKMRLNKEKALVRLVLLIALVVIIKTPIPKPTTWQWHDACESGTTWSEYMEEVRIDD